MVTEVKSRERERKAFVQGVISQYDEYSRCLYLPGARELARRLYPDPVVLVPKLVRINNILYGFDHKENVIYYSKDKTFVRTIGVKASTFDQLCSLFDTKGKFSETTLDSNIAIAWEEYKRNNP